MSKYTRKCSDKYNRKAVLQYSMKEELIREWATVGEIHRELGFDKSAILRCCKGKQQRSYWFIWRFKEDVEAAKQEVENEGEPAIVSQVVQTTEGSYTKGD